MGGKREVGASRRSLEALKPWNIHALAKRQLQRGLKCIYKGWPLLPSQGCGKGRASSVRGRKADIFSARRAQRPWSSVSSCRATPRSSSPPHRRQAQRKSNTP